MRLPLIAWRFLEWQNTVVIAARARKSSQIKLVVLDGIS